MRQNISSGAPWEDKVGYSRAVRLGNIIEVTGTVSIKNDKPFAIGDPYEQTKRSLEIIGSALAEAGASFKDIVRTRIFVTDISQWEEIGRAHSEVFNTIKPATTMVEVSKLMDPEYLVEIEATAILE